MQHSVVEATIPLQNKSYSLEHSQLNFYLMSNVTLKIIILREGEIPLKSKWQMKMFRKQQLQTFGREINSHALAN